MQQKVYNYKDFLHLDNIPTESRIGRKGKSLSFLVKNKIPVPPFLLITTDVFNQFIRFILKHNIIKNYEDLHELIRQTPLDQDTIRLLSKHYKSLSGIGKAWMAIRSSISAPDYPELSFSGQLDTYLNVRGMFEIELAIKEVYASIFGKRMLAYIHEHKIDVKKISTAIIAQKMIQSEVSGLAYTYNPITLESNNITIEAVFGLGDVIATGEINPDIYIIDKLSGKLIEKKIMPQEWMRTRRIGETDEFSHNQKVPISKVWQYSQKLSEKNIEQLVYIIKQIDSIFDNPQIVEWTLSGNNIYILQVKPDYSALNLVHQSDNNMYQSVDTRSHFQSDKTLKQISKDEDIKRYISSNSDVNSNTKEVNIKSNPSVSKIGNRATKIEEDGNENIGINLEKESLELKSTTVILTGEPVSPGNASAKPIVVSVDNIERLAQSLRNKKFIAVVDRLLPELENLLLMAVAVVANSGGKNTDMVQVLKEKRIPVVVNTRIGTKLLPNYDLVLVEGDSGAIKTVTSNYKSKDKKGISNLQSSKLIDVHLPLTIISPVTKYVYMDITELKRVSDVYVYINIEEEFKINKAVISKLVNLKKSNNQISFILNANIGEERLTKVKGSLVKYGFRRSSRTKLYVEISTLIDLMNIKKFASLLIDGFVINAASLFKSFAPKAKNYVLSSDFISLIDMGLSRLELEEFEFVGLKLPTRLISVNKPSIITSLLRTGFSHIIIPDLTASDDKILDKINNVVDNILL